MMRDHKIHNTVAVRVVPNRDQLGLYWTDEDGNNSTLICYVFGFENASRVANGIAHNQCEFVTHPCFNPVTGEVAYIMITATEWEEM